MYEIDPKSITIDFTGSSSDVWYEQVDLVRLVAADNVLEKIDKRIIEFDALTFIDVSYKKVFININIMNLFHNINVYFQILSSFIIIIYQIFLKNLVNYKN